MAIYVKDREAEALLRDYANEKQLSVTAALKRAVETARKRDAEAEKRRQAELLATIRGIQERWSELPRTDMKEADAWLYGEDGLPR